MRTLRFVSVFAAVVFGCAVVCAQIGGTISAGPTPGRPASEAPFTVSRTTKNVQTLANGATITTISTSKMARDSSGRTYFETHRVQPMGGDGESTDFWDARITDLQTRTTITWTSFSKEANLVHMPEPVSRPAPMMKGPAGQSQLGRPRRPQVEVQSEDLGTRTIAGVPAVGHRMTRVIPVGQEGNDQPLTIVDEAWISQENGQVMMSIHDDPRTGVSTTEVTDMQFGEPDATLFQVPEGYTVKDRTQPQAN